MLLRCCMQIKFASAVTMDDLVYGSEFKAPLDLSAATKKVLDAAVAACKRVLGSGEAAKCSQPAQVQVASAASSYVATVYC